VIALAGVIPKAIATLRQLDQSSRFIAYLYKAARLTSLYSAIIKVAVTLKTQAENFHKSYLSQTSDI
jgi:hypothetical protein